MSYAYADCFFCGANVKESKLPRDVWRNGRLLVIEDVPTGVCCQCGEKYVRPEVAKAIDHLLETTQSAPRTIKVDVYALPELEKDAA